MAMAAAVATAAELPSGSGRGGGCRRVEEMPIKTGGPGLVVHLHLRTGMAHVNDLEFAQFLLPGMFKDKLRLPDVAGMLGDRQELKMRLVSGGAMPMPLFDVELVSSDDGVYLGRGWTEFASTYGLEMGYLLVFRHDSAAVLNVKVFDSTTCRKEYYPHSVVTPDAESAGRNAPHINDAPHINEPAHFNVTLKNYNLRAEQGYLNVPVDFQRANGYAPGQHVVLQKGGRSWTVNLKSCKGGRPRGRTAFQSGWHQFCVDNGLEVGDICYFRVVREHVLKVEVLKNGTFLF